MLNKLISYKGILHERTEDAPFMGALIIGASCRNNCRDCFNQRLKESTTFYKYAAEIIAEVKQNHFNDGIILAGLEWSEQPDDVISLVSCAFSESLKVILYTGLYEAELFERIPSKYLIGCYVKFGPYDRNKLSKTHISEGVHLASTNQYIKLMQ